MTYDKMIEQHDLKECKMILNNIQLLSQNPKIESKSGF